MPDRPHILITNDDGIHAPGIKHLWQALLPHANLTVVAPSLEQSSMGLSITLRHPLRIEPTAWDHQKEGIWNVNGTPADCVKLALHTLFTKKPDLVIAGINRGSNLGRGLLYSGTVAAAIESILQEIPAIAFSSLDYSEEPNYIELEKYIPHIVQYVLKHPLPKGTLLNVNFPEKQFGKVKGFKMVAQGKEWWAEKPEKRIHPIEGHTYYWLGSELRDYNEEDEGFWIRQGYITAVPVQVSDLTDRNYLEAKSALFEKSFPL